MLLTVREKQAIIWKDRISPRKYGLELLKMSMPHHIEMLHEVTRHTRFSHLHWVINLFQNIYTVGICRRVIFWLSIRSGSPYRQLHPEIIVTLDIYTEEASLLSTKPHYHTALLQGILLIFSIDSAWYKNNWFKVQFACERHMDITWPRRIISIFHSLSIC